MKKLLLSLITIFSFVQYAQAQNFHVDEDFNAAILPAGWSVNALVGTANWGVGIDGASVHGGANNIDGTALAYFDDDFNQANAFNNAVIVTPIFNNASIPKTTLSFEYNFRQINGLSDSLIVEVFDGSSWTEVFFEVNDNCGSYIANNCVNLGFPSATIDISTLNNTNCQVRFRFTDGGTSDGWGWYAGIDNVQIFSPLSDNIGVSQIVSPESGCGLSATQPLTVRVQNYGLNPTSSFDVSYNINGGAQVATETVAAIIAPGDSLDYTFTTLTNFSVPQTYNVVAFTTLAADLDATDDSTSAPVISEALFPLSYTEGFENANSGWSSSGVNNDWARGVPAGTTISSATQGTNAFVTDLTGAYNSNQTSYLTSPCFDFSSGTGDPFVTFDLIYQTEPNFDYFFMESSIDNGATWQKINAGFNPTNWYNFNIPSIGNVWNGNSGGWLSVENVLTGLGGQSQVKLRFAFKSDGGSNSFEGVGVDNFGLRFPQAVDASVNSIVYPAQGNTPLCGFGLENIQIDLENKGANQIDTLVVSYQVDANPVSFDTIFQAFLPGTGFQYTFNTRFDFSALQNYNLSVWIDARGDGFSANDSLLNRTVINSGVINVASTPFFENFDNAPFIAGTGFSNNNSTIGNGWVRIPTPNQYTWNVAFDQSNLSGATGPAADHTTGAGNFMYTEASNGGNNDVANLETPCLDFSTAQGGRLEFWSYRYGTQINDPLHVDVFDGINWINGVYSITGTQQTNGNQPWTFNQVDLNAFAGRRIKIRFRGISDGCCSGDQAIDDVRVYEPLPRDAEMLAVIAPQNDCSLDDTTAVIVEIGNFGTLDIPADSVYVFYQVDNLPIVEDTLDVSVAIGGSTQFQFTVGADFSVVNRQYNLTVWTESNGDRNVSNDSIQDYSVINYKRTSGYIENFTTFIDGDCNDPEDDILVNGWSRANNKDYTWNVQNTRVCIGPNGATNTQNTGPNGDNTTGNGKFMYTEADLSGPPAELISPCIDFTQNIGASVAFWYHTFGTSTGTTFIDVFANGMWNLGVGSFLGRRQNAINDPWILDAVNLNQFAGELVQVRFRTSRTGNLGDVSLDDIEFYEPIDFDSRVSAFISPITECGPDGNTIIEVRNFGALAIPADSIRVAYTIDGLFVVRDTIPVSIPVGGSYNHTFSVPVDMSEPAKTFSFTAWTELTGDSNGQNDTLFNYQITNLTQPATYKENFESFTDGSCANATNANANDILRRGWTEQSTGTYAWHVHDVTLCGGTASGNTGPASDHTLGIGKFMFTEASGASGSARLVSPCVKEAGAMKFWYHKFGTGQGNLFVDVFANNTWNLGVLSRPGQTQFAENDPWLEDVARFPQFANQEIRIRFRAENPGGFTSDMGIDDIEFVKLFRKDAALTDVLGPVSGCEISDSAVISIEFQNVGFTNIDPDSLIVGYQVDNLPPVFDTIPFGLTVSQTGTWDFTGAKAADLSVRGKQYVIKAFTALLNENKISDDTLFNYIVTNQTKVTNYLENFESSRSASCDTRLGDALDNGWTVTSTTAFNWHVQATEPICGNGTSATPTANTGPFGDHTTGKGTFLYTQAEGNSAAGTAVVESPCLDFSADTAVNMTFWYHKYGNGCGNLIAEVTDGSGGWTNLATIVGQTQNSATEKWKQRTVSLKPYLSQGLMQVRFRATGNNVRSNIAIDDIIFYVPSTRDVGIVEISSPSTTSCNLTTATVTTLVQNFGIDDIPAGDIEMTFNNNNGVQVVTDTIRQLIPAGGSISYSFPTPVDLSNPGRQSLRVTAKLIGDTILYNNVATTEVSNLQPGLPVYRMDFENHRPGFYEGWVRNPTGGGYFWDVACDDGAPYNDGLPPAPPRQPTGPSGDHTFASSGGNGNGCYMYVNSAGGGSQEATLTLPCGSIDLSNSNRNRVLFSFWYHMFGGLMGDLFIDVNLNNGAGWVQGISVIRGPAASVQDDSDPWKLWQVSLDPYVGNSNVQLRFRAKAAGNEGDMAIDDIQILDRRDADATLTRLIRPQSDCGLTNAERIRVEAQNLGTLDILSLPVAYQVTFTPFAVNSLTFQPIDSQSIVFPIVRDLIAGNTIVPLARSSFDIPTRLNMSAPGRYDIKVWTELLGDQYKFNDTLRVTRFNETRPFPSCENFSSVLYDDIGKLFSGSKFTNNWVGDANNYSWKASLQDANGNGGPTKGHTGGFNDLYMLALDADGSPGQTTTLSSPCFDLSNTNSANMEFWYQAPAADHLLTIEVQRNGGGWQPGVDTLFGPARNGKAAIVWTKHVTALTDFVGGTVNVRFKAHNTGQYYAVDDICIIRPPTQQIELEAFIVPPVGNCFYSDSTKVQLRIQNIGSDFITQFDLILAVDKDLQAASPGQYVRDTVTVNPVNFGPGAKIDVELDLPGFIVDMSDYTDYFFNAYIELPGDINRENNILENYKVNHPVPIELPYLVDFEDVKGEGAAWPLSNSLNAFGGPFIWQEASGVGVGDNQFTGPGVDHTLGIKGDPSGSYLVADARNFMQPGDQTTFFTRCINLRQATNPEMKYWYYMFGLNVGTLTLEVNDDKGWVAVDNLAGQDPDQRLNNFQPWKERTVSLRQYAGKVIRYRFTASKITSNADGDIALDDILVYDLANKDITPDGIVEPSKDTTYCYTANNPFCVQLTNNGADSIDFTVDTTFINVSIFRDGNPIPEILIDTVDVNSFRASGIGPIIPLPRDSSITYCLDQTFDMSNFGTDYRFIIDVNMITDDITRNDSWDETIKSQRLVGSVFRVVPNDSVCSGDQVQLSAKDFFGAIRWEERVYASDNSQSFFTGFGQPNNEKDYRTPVDTLTDYRIKVCNDPAFVSNVVQVRAFKPFAPIGISDTSCFPGIFTVRAQVEPNIDFVAIWDTPFGNSGTDSLTGSVVPFQYQTTILGYDTLRTPVTDSLEALRDSSKAYWMTSYIIANTSTGLLECVSNSRLDSKVEAVLLGKPVSPLSSISPLDTISVCQDSSFILNGGKVVGRRDFYDWRILLPNGDTLRDSLQTIAVDAYLLDLDKVYTYILNTTSEDGCSNESVRINVLITDSCITGINETALNEQFSIYPNPVSEQLTIEFGANTDLRGSIQLVSMEGQLIQSFEKLNFKNFKQIIEMGTLPKGVYFIKINTDQGTIVEKIVRS